MGIRIAAALTIAVACAFPELHAQPDLTGVVSGSTIRHMAVPDFRGAGAAQPLMDVFNQTLWGDLKDSGLIDLVNKTKYPLFIPQVPGDFQDPAGIPEAPKRRGAPTPVMPVNGGGRWLSDWSGAPVSANFLAFGYAAVQNGVFVAYGNLYNLSNTNLSNAKALSDRYLASSDEAGAKKTAHDFAAAIIKAIGGTPIFNSHIYFISDRTGHRELWMMDADGSNQRQISKGNFITRDPAVSPDGSKVACAAQPAEGTQTRIQLYSTSPVLQLTFRNPPADYVAQPSFTPDGRLIFAFGSQAGYGIAISNADGSAERVVSTTKSLQVQPTVNPQNPGVIAFVSDRGRYPQVYTMSADGVDASRVSNGVGEAVDPSWNPNGRFLAFAWTQGYEPGNYNIFYMPVGENGSPIQLTANAGRNEHPSWAPDGAHIAFQSNRGGSFQIYSTLVSGTSEPTKLTSQGNNISPVWGR